MRHTPRKARPAARPQPPKPPSKREETVALIRMDAVSQTLRIMVEEVAKTVAAELLADPDLHSLLAGKVRRVARDVVTEIVGPPEPEETPPA